MREALTKGGGLMGSPIDEDGNPDPRGVRLAEAMKMINTTTGHHDVAQRLKDMDMDGVCAEVVFPSSHNGESEPFIMNDAMLDPSGGDNELFGVGLRIYAEWLVDACKQADGRLIGLITPPLWDIDASIETVKWAHAQGLKGVFLLMPRRGVLRYDRPRMGAVLGPVRRPGHEPLHPLRRAGRRGGVGAVGPGDDRGGGNRDRRLAGAQARPPDDLLRRVRTPPAS